jgi:hypothetical protein
MVKKKALWLKNNTGSDVSISDLGVKVLANQTTNVYAYNPYITEQQVKDSMESGSLAKRLESKVLSVVKGTKKARPHTLDHIKTSADVVEVVKSKTAVFIDTKEEDVLSDEELGDIADYGLGELGHSNTANIKTKDGSIVVKQKEDTPEDEISDVEVKFEKVKSSNVSEQSIVAVTKQVESQSDPVGPMADNSSTADQPFVVVQPPKDPEPQKATAIQEAEEKLKASKVKKVGDAFVVDGKDAESRNIKAIAAGDSPDTNDSVSNTYDAQVATKDESGAIVMKVKEVAEKETTEPVETEKPKVVKVAKKKAKKKTSKKPRKKKTSKKKTS